MGDQMHKDLPNYSEAHWLAVHSHICHAIRRHGFVEFYFFHHSETSTIVGNTRHSGDKKRKEENGFVTHLDGLDLQDSVHHLLCIRTSCEPALYNRDMANTTEWA